MVLRYSTQIPEPFPGEYKDEPVEFTTKEEWLKLINFANEEIPAMPEAEIHKRISALKSIAGAPHYSFNLSMNNDPKFMELIEHVYDTTLNGGAINRITILEDYLAGKGIPPRRL
jgi:hypothetical protein